MKWSELDRKIQRSEWHKFYVKNRRLLLFFEGLVIIGLLIAINIYFYQDWQVKEQIRDRCGYTHNDWECVCTQDAVNAYRGEPINITLDATKNINAQNLQNDELAG